MISRLTNKVTHILMSDEFETATYVKVVLVPRPPAAHGATQAD